MFEFFKKKHKGPNKPKGNNDDAKTMEAPDAESVLDSIDAALKAADKEKERERHLLLDYERSRFLGSCSC